MEGGKSRCGDKLDTITPLQAEMSITHIQMLVMEIIVERCVR